MCVRVCRGVCVWVCTSGADKATVCVNVCKGLCVWMCTGGAGIATRVCMCACIWVCGNVQWLDKDCKTHAKEKLTHQLTCIQLKAWLIYINLFPKQQYLYIKTTPA